MGSLLICCAQARSSSSNTTCTAELQYPNNTQMFPWQFFVSRKLSFSLQLHSLTETQLHETSHVETLNFRSFFWSLFQSISLCSKTLPAKPPSLLIDICETSLQVNNSPEQESVALCCYLYIKGFIEPNWCSV